MDFFKITICDLKTGRGQYSKYLPFAFTEQGVAMLSSVLNNEKAIEINIAIMRSFVSLRKFALTYEELTKRVTEIEQQFATPVRLNARVQTFIKH